MLTPETVLQSRYRVVRQLGQGGMGAVYEGVDERLDSTIALKETLFADEPLRKQFEREARLLARLHHPALPRVSDHFSEGEGQFLVMHFIGGDDLAEMSAKRRGPFPVSQVLTWADQLLDALDYLHTQDPQIIHRDIKPQNLKLTPRGQIILLDFGLAKGQAGDISRITTSGSIFGYTPNYAPLEQVQGLGTDARSDLYALAATLYHLMTGVKPPDALTRAAAIVNGQPDPLKLAYEVNNAIGSGVAEVLQKAMAQNREQRYASAAEMRKALIEVGAAATTIIQTEANTVLLAPSDPTVAAETRANAIDPTIQTGESTVLHRPERSRRQPQAIVVAAVVLLIVGVSGFYAYQSRNQSTSAEAPANDEANPSAAQSELTGGGTSATADIAEESKTEKQPAAEPVIRKEKVTNQKSVADRQREDRAAAAAAAERAKAEQRSRQEQDNRDENAVDDQRPQQPNVRRRVGNTVIRNLPDGSQVITGQDGSRVIVSPDGSQQVIRPGRRTNRRRFPRRPY